MTDVIVVIGPGEIGQAIARRVDVGKHILLADVRQENADAAAEVLENAGYEVSVATAFASVDADRDNGAVALYGAARFRGCDGGTANRVGGAGHARKLRGDPTLP